MIGFRHNKMSVDVVLVVSKDYSKRMLRMSNVIVIYRMDVWQ